MVDISPDPETVPAPGQRKLTASELAAVIPTVMADPSIQGVLDGVRNADKQSLRDLDRNLRQVFAMNLHLRYGMDLIIAAAGDPKVNVTKLKENWKVSSEKLDARLKKILEEK